MKKWIAVVGLIGLVSAMPNPAQSAVGFSIFISNAPPPPRVVFYHQPRFVLIPEEDVYACEDSYYSDYDVFRYGDYFYLYDDGYWYRSPSYRGPFLAIRVDYVPRRIFSVGSYGYQCRERPRYVTYPTTYRRYETPYRTYERPDWRYRSSTYLRDMRQRRYVQPAPEQRDWSDRSSGNVERDRGRRDQGDQGRGNGNGNGNGRGRGNGHGRGHGRGHGGD